MLLGSWISILCLSAAWHVRSIHGRLHVNNWFAASAVRWAISQLRTSSERKLSLSATRLPFTVEIALLDVFSLSNSLFFASFLRLSDLSHRQEQAGSMPSTQAIPPSPGHNRDGSEKVRTFDKEAIATNRLIAKDSLASCGCATFNCPYLVEVWAPTGECSPPDHNRSIFFAQTFVDFALSLLGHSLWVFLHPGPRFFSQKRQIRTTNEN